MVSARIPALLSAIAGFGLALGVHAQSAPAPSTPSAPAPRTAPPAEISPALDPAAVQAENNAPTGVRRNRAISPEVAAQLAANTPKFSPPPPKPAPKPEEQVDMREIDRPRNDIPRLDPVYVREPRDIVLKERDVSTSAGLADIAVRRYLSEVDRAMNRVTIPLFGSSSVDRAIAMYNEDERLQNMATLQDAAQTAAKSDPAAGEYVRKQAQQTFMRSSDFGWSGGGPRGWTSEAGAAVRAVGGQPK